MPTKKKQLASNQNQKTSLQRKNVTLRSGRVANQYKRDTGSLKPTLNVSVPNSINKNIESNPNVNVNNNIITSKVVEENLIESQIFCPYANTNSPEPVNLKSDLNENATVNNSNEANIENVINETQNSLCLDTNANCGEPVLNQILNYEDIPESNQMVPAFDFSDDNLLIEPEDPLSKLFGFFPDKKAHANELLNKLLESSVFQKMMSKEDWKSFVNDEVVLLELIQSYKSLGWSYFSSEDYKDYGEADILIKLLRRLRKFEKLQPTSIEILSKESIMQNSNSKLCKRKKTKNLENSIENTSFFTKLPKENRLIKKIKLIPNQTPVTAVLEDLASSSANPVLHANLLDELSGSSHEIGNLDVNNNEEPISDFPSGSMQIELPNCTEGPHPERPRPKWLTYVNKAPKKGEKYPRQAILVDLYPFKDASCDIEDIKSSTFVSLYEYASKLNPKEVTWTDLRDISRRLINRLTCHLIGPGFRRLPYFDPDNMKVFTASVAAKYWKLLEAYGLIYKQFVDLSKSKDPKAKGPFGVKFDSTFNGVHQNYGSYLYTRLHRRLEAKKAQMRENGIVNVWLDETQNSDQVEESEKPRGRGRPRKHPLTTIAKGKHLRKSKVPNVIKKKNYDEDEDFSDIIDIPDYYVDPVDKYYV